MTEVPTCAVAIMAKAPWPGQVKTRLCPPLSYEEAAELYRCFLLDKIEQVKALKKATPAIAYTPEDAKSLFEDMASPSFIFIPQQGVDLGSRLFSTLHQLLGLGYTKVIAIDSDTPTLSLDYIQRALTVLSEPEIDLVLGPCEDGGYYLIGLRKLHRELFDGITWSSAHVFSQTIRRAQAKGLNVACLPSWYDVDTPEDLQHLKTLIQLDNSPGAQNTKRFFNKHSK
ncbi:MAG: TIGR04282 family arsenosugar biosynthesis glycosyltransferase [Deltaproteobacteria bacterium]|nr:TIGR04282 family arsenosugar biosynthesis glycosyltransferase [Deltaproteobacteria bacterium]